MEFLSTEDAEKVMAYTTSNEVRVLGMLVQVYYSRNKRFEGGATAVAGATGGTTGTVAAQPALNALDI